MVGFDPRSRRLRFAKRSARQDGLLQEDLAGRGARAARLVQPPPALHPARPVRRAAHGRAAGLDAFLTLSSPSTRASCCSRTDTLTEDERKGLPPIYELAWNHTTLRALKVDPAITYLQTQYPFPDQLDTGQRIDARSATKMPMHLEIIRFDGKIVFSGLPIVRYTTEARLDEIIRLHEDNRLPGLQPAPLHARGRRHEADRRACSSRSRAGRSQGHAQPRQDDRLGRPRLRLSGPARPGCSTAWPHGPDDLMRVMVLYAHPFETASTRSAPPRRRDPARRRPRGRRLRPLRRGLRPGDEPRGAARLSRRAGQHDAGRRLCRPAERPRRWCSSSRSGTTASRRSSRAISTASSCPASRSTSSTARSGARSPTSAGSWR